MILLLDNYDSFVHNVARYLRLAGKATRVIRSDAITVAQCYRMQPEAIILSPGPHRPEQAGCCIDVVKELAGEIPILGICLGHQAIAAAYAASVVISPPAHAIASSIEHNNTGVFSGLPQPMAVGRYHSLCVDAASLPGPLEVTAWTTAQHSTQSPLATLAPTQQRMQPDCIVMGISDHARCVHGVQFHPESLLTEQGHELIQNFFALVDRHHARARQVAGADLGTGRPVVWMSRSGHPSNRLFADAKSDRQEDSAHSPAGAGGQTPLPLLSIAAPRQLGPSRPTEEPGR